jgi:hypothetical protein
MTADGHGPTAGASLILRPAPERVAPGGRSRRRSSPSASRWRKGGRLGREIELVGRLARLARRSGRLRARHGKLRRRRASACGLCVRLDSREIRPLFPILMLSRRIAILDARRVEVAFQRRRLRCSKNKPVISMRWQALRQSCAFRSEQRAFPPEKEAFRCVNEASRAATQADDAARRGFSTSPEPPWRVPAGRCFC